jgi:transcriptional regulator with XRE-family HTH domain
VAGQEEFFRALGQRIRALRADDGYSQEDMISFGFSARHWQQIEAGRPITLTTLLRICDTFEIRPGRLLKGCRDRFRPARKVNRGWSFAICLDQL